MNTECEKHVSRHALILRCTHGCRGRSWVNTTHCVESTSQELSFRRSFVRNSFGRRVSPSHITSRPRSIALSRARAAVWLEQTTNCGFVPDDALFATAVLQLRPSVCTRIHCLFQHLTEWNVRPEECGALLTVRRWGNKILTSASDGAVCNHRAIQSLHIDCNPRTPTTLAAGAM